MLEKQIESGFFRRFLIAHAIKMKLKIQFAKTKQNAKFETEAESQMIRVK